jgi:hypothetical protein
MSLDKMNTHRGAIGVWLVIWLAGCAGAPSPAPVTAMPTLLIFDAATPTQGTPAVQATWVTQMPPTGLGISGRLIFTEGPLGVTQWNLETNQISPLFVPPQNGVVNAASLSPDGETIVMAYGPPPPPGKPQIGYTSLYTVPSDGSAEPTPLIPGEHNHEFFFTPRWSASGDAVFYGHYIESRPDVTSPPGFFLKRKPFPVGDTITIATDAFIPYVSRDGKAIAYITVDMKTYLNNLYVADADGSNAVALLPSGTLWAIDSVAISPDGRAIVFSGDSNGPTVAQRPAIYDWLGLRVAQAHSIPEDLWLIPVTGGAAKRITSLGVVGLTADYSPDGEHIAFIGSNGTYIVSADGSNLTRLDSSPKFGTIQWAQ